MNHRPELFHRESFSRSELSQGGEQGQPGSQAGGGRGPSDHTHALSPAVVFPGEHGDPEAKAGPVPAAGNYM